MKLPSRRQGQATKRVSKVSCSCKDRRAPIGSTVEAPCDGWSRLQGGWPHRPQPGLRHMETPLYLHAEAMHKTRSLTEGYCAGCSPTCGMPASFLCTLASTLAMFVADVSWQDPVMDTHILRTSHTRHRPPEVSSAIGVLKLLIQTRARTYAQLGAHARSFTSLHSHARTTELHVASLARTTELHTHMASYMHPPTHAPRLQSPLFSISSPSPPPPPQQ